mmetsp:Transcript_20695/g.29729  ORF Transcript_20695/g.29729 Transcript_20695/m.29729 type:complete len:367 (+) Transcript_20695:205-1305(+)|eukprot:CAMPEP_0185035394 /NCGR_PEP_ID=MMETSP1103-20130426/26645_1 /TAXON_ID=36769 /ORGANISM="Paraphysomonas bandaiensis, Strain Caron Lab Isolate" /LENGTH=366 /DNA_ID=CAMNT_0027572441 /DNA_START=119 /DNA_END=1219 /DNA_ORIENTATION=-
MDACNLIVNYLPPDMGESELRALFSPHGKIVRSKVVREKASGKSACYGFVLFKNEASAAEALTAKNGMVIKSKTLKVSIARPRKKNDISNSKLYITGLPASYATADVEELFSKYGEVVSMRLLRHSDGSSKGKAFLEYNEPSECDEAMTKLHGVTLPGSSVALSVLIFNPNHYERRRLSESLEESNAQSELSAGAIIDCPLASQSPKTGTLSIETKGNPLPTPPVHAVSSPSYGQHPYPVYAAASPAQPPGGPQGSIFWNECHSHVVSPVSADVASLRYTFKIWDIPPYTNIGHLYHIFSHYGIVLSAAIDVAFSSSNGYVGGYVCSGTGTVDMLGTPGLKDAALVALNSTIVFEGWSLIKVAILC